jgi:hypothetical protein
MSNSIPGTFAVHRALLLVLFFSFLSICRVAEGVERSDAFRKSLVEHEHDRCAPHRFGKFSAGSLR